MPPEWFGFIEEVHDGYHAGGGVVYLSRGNTLYGCLHLVNEARDVFDEVVVECFFLQAARVGFGVPSRRSRGI